MTAVSESKYEYLKNIEGLESLYRTLTEEQTESSYARCIRYGKNLESLVRFVYSVQFPNYKSSSSMLSSMLKDKSFKEFLGKSEYYNKAHFVYIAGEDGALNHDIDEEIATLAYENLRELTYVIFSKIDKFSDSEKEMYSYVPVSVPAISEQETRKYYIDASLRKAGYKVNNVKDSKGHGHPVANNVCVEIEVHNLPHQNVGYADYVIYNKAGLPLAVIEAKRTSVDVEAGAQQVRDYADALQRELMLPYRLILYYTNGYVLRIQDRLGYPARVVGNFASMSDLELMIKRQQPGTEDSRKPITDGKVNENIINRSKLIESVKALVGAMNAGGKMRRKGLLVLPCGVGKTRTAVALTDILLRNDWAQNVLFLADRSNLVTNAVKPFRDFLTSCSASDISAENPERDLNARICVCTYNSMLNYLNKADNPFSVGHFDIIFVDEAHRSLFNVYRSIFEYFDSFVVGLTATPSKAIDRSTYDILDLNVDEPTFELKFEEAVNLGYLVSYKAFDKTSYLLREGLKYDNLSDREKEEYEEKFDSDSDDRDIPPEAFRRTITNSGHILNEKTIDKMLVDLFRCGLRVDKGQKIGKTLIFARDHNHAVKIVERFKKNYPELGDEYCQVIDTQINKNLTRQTNFAKKDSNPRIVVSVDMMDTGVDIPEIVNLVFFKRVLSRIKFDQMWGRGTRTCKDLYVISPSADYFNGRTSDDTRREYPDKQGFFVFDYCDNFEYFNEHPAGVDPSPALNIDQKIISISLDILYLLQTAEYQEKEEYRSYYRKVEESIIDSIKSLNTDRVDVRPKIEYIDKYKNPNAFEPLSKAGVYEIKSHLLPLLNQNLLEDTSDKSFAYKVSIIQNSILDERINSTSQKLAVRQTAKALMKKASLDAIRTKIGILRRIDSDEFWSDEKLDFFELENIKTEVGPLIKFLKGDKEEIIITSFNDVIATTERESSFNFDDFIPYREKIISYIRKHMGDLESIQKIIRLEPLSEDDLSELQEILDSLKSQDVDESELFSSKEELIIFIRKIIGLDTHAIDTKCAQFLNDNTFNTEQLKFIDLIIDYAVHNGNITREVLVNEEPFCEEEIDDLFQNRIDCLFKLVDVFNRPLSEVA